MGNWKRVARQRVAGQRESVEGGVGFLGCGVSGSAGIIGL